MQKPFKIINVPRLFAATEATKETLGRLAPGPWAWIFIGEPIDGLITQPDSEFRFNGHIRKLPKLEIRFWDITKSKQTHLLVDGTFREETIHPINEEQADELYQFLKDNSDKNLIVSCYQGVCRSGAVAQFCEKYFHYDWLEGFKKKAHPNTFVYQRLVDAWAKDLYCTK